MFYVLFEHCLVLTYKGSEFQVEEPDTENALLSSFVLVVGTTK